MDDYGIKAIGYNLLPILIGIVIVALAAWGLWEASIYALQMIAVR